MLISRIRSNIVSGSVMFISRSIWDYWGATQRLLWNEIYTHILDILSARSSHQGIVMCKNFHKVHSELLDTFYSYMQTLEHIGVDLAYVFITEQVSFLPSGILERCQVVPIRRPTKGAVEQVYWKESW